MSVFKVALNNVDQGLLDLNPGTASPGGVTGQGLGTQMQPSIQRGVYIMGPNLVNRLLNDGDQFTDCNYWKRFAYPQVPLNEAFIEVITDDGSIYSDVPSENTYPLVYDRTIDPGDTFGDNEIDIVGDTGGFATFAQITNNGAGAAIKVRLNGLTSAAFDLDGGDTQVFNSGDLSISLIEFDNTASGAAVADVQVILSVRSVCFS